MNGTIFCAYDSQAIGLLAGHGSGLFLQSAIIIWAVERVSVWRTAARAPSV